MSRGPVKPEEIPDAEARLPPPPPADPLARGVSEVLVRDPRPARPPAREGAPHPALRAASHPGRPDQRRSAGEPRRGGALRRRGRALVGEPGRPRAGARDPGSAASRPRAPRGRAALHRPRALGALARDRAADPPCLTRPRPSARAPQPIDGGARREPRGRLTAAREAREQRTSPQVLWGEAERESARAGRRGLGAPEARSACEARASTGRAPRHFCCAPPDPSVDSRDGAGRPGDRRGGDRRRADPRRRRLPRGGTRGRRLRLRRSDGGARRPAHAEPDPPYRPVRNGHPARPALPVHPRRLPLRLRAARPGRLRPAPPPAPRRRPRGAGGGRHEPPAGNGERLRPRPAAAAAGGVGVGEPPARPGPCVAHHQLRARGLQPDPRAAARRRAGADGVPADRGGPRPRAGGNRRPADRPARRDEQQRDRAARPSADGVPAPDGGLTMARIIVSGARPTGRQHLGNYHGALKNWLRLQGEHRCFFFVADWHALTTDWAAPEALEENTVEMVLDWLAVGLDPARATLFQQSAVKEHAELYLLLGMLTPVPWLERNPTYKEQRAELQDRDLSTYGFLGYPVLQTADVLMYKAWGVPVGIDQAPHIELAREIARRFNATYGETFPEPQTLLTDTPRIAGTDGRKMSKSYGNAVYLTDPAKEVEAKLARMITDSRRARRTDPGDPNDCPAR